MLIRRIGENRQPELIVAAQALRDADLRFVGELVAIGLEPALDGGGACLLRADMEKQLAPEMSL